MESAAILFSNNIMGHAPVELGKLLLRNYLTILKDEKKIPGVFLFYGEGVKLICNGSDVIDLLHSFEKKGVKLIACKTCLNFYELIDEVKIGHIGTMADIVTLQMEAEKVINI